MSERKNDRVRLQQRVADLWTWLPAFRAVAEVEHVQRAARTLNVTASSLSRAVGLIEDRLGRRLFERVGRNIQLNHDGKELLAAVRDGMRRIDDGVARVTGTVFAGELRVASEGDLPMAFLWRAAARLTHRHDGLRVTVEKAPHRAELAPLLLRGELDVAIVSTAPVHARLLVQHLGDVTYGIYCGTGHALHRVAKPNLRAICEHPFVAPTSSAGDEGSRDQWPDGVDRIVVLRLPALEPAIAACAAGELLAVLPDIAVANAAAVRQLRRLPSEAVPTSSLFAIQRRPTGEADRSGAFVAELRASVQEMLARPARGSVTARPGRRPSSGGRSRRGAR